MCKKSIDTIFISIFKIGSKCVVSGCVLERITVSDSFIWLVAYVSDVTEMTTDRAAGFMIYTIYSMFIVVVVYPDVPPSSRSPRLRPFTAIKT